MLTAKYFGVKRFAIHDGDGIRTTLFLSGCPLKCKWCHNPEGLNNKSILAYYQDKCINCGECVLVCENNAHQIIDGKHIFNRTKCMACGKCESVCLGNALTFYGRDISVDQAFNLLCEDRAFYGENGGATLSGGECLMQGEFCIELAKLLKENGINTDIDTCGFVDKMILEKILPFVDTFLYDIKGIDKTLHKENCGVDNDVILDNIKFLSEHNAKIEVRIPYIPDCNKNEMQSIARFLQTINIKGVRILPYNNLCGSKYQALGLTDNIPLTPVQNDELNKIQDIFQSTGIKVIK